MLRIQPRQWKNKDGSITKTWRLIVVDYRTNPTGESIYPEKSKYHHYGLDPDDTLEEAKKKLEVERAKQRVKRDSESRARIERRLSKEAVVQSAYLPVDLVNEFEETILLDGLYGDDESNQRNKVMSHWRACKRMLCELKIEPEDWADRKRAFYVYFIKRKYSPSYLQKVIRILNMWGKFVSKRQKRFFEELPYPTRFDKHKIADAFLSKTDGGMASEALDAALLAEKEEALEVENFEWLHVSLWFGLRPSEVEALKNQKYWRVETHQGKRVLWVYQAKLKGVSEQDRWKYIPCLHKEQTRALKMVESGRFRRPCIKTMQTHFGDRYTRYAGRKGFEPLMDSLGHPLEKISLWLGHKSIERTWRNYKNRKKIVL